MPPLDPSAQDLPNLKISGPNAKPRASTRHHSLRRSCHFYVNWAANSDNRNHHLIQHDPIYKTWKFQNQKPNHAPSKDPPLDAYSDTRSYFLSRANTRRHFSHSRTCATCVHGLLLYDVIFHTRFDPGRPGLTRSSWPGPNCLKKRKKRKSFDQVELWLWPKSQNFPKGPVLLSFSSTFRFWDPFLHLKLGNCAKCPIPKKLTFAQILTKKSKFSRSTCLVQFFV